tara:strand:+ start:9836 stop:10471 length:636 start_codon:yes stop_codon:yes gene_type:complete
MTARHRHTMLVTHDMGGLHRLFDADRVRLGLYLFFGTLLFASLLLAFALHYRQTPAVFAAAAAELHRRPAVLGGALLISAGWALTRAAGAAERGASTTGGMLLTLMLGLGFLAARGWEGYLEYQGGVLPLGQPFGYDGPHPLEALRFFHFHHLVAVLHGVFVLIALATMLPALTGGDGERRLTRLRLAGGYWALVEIVWVADFTAFYLIGA